MNKLFTSCFLILAFNQLSFAQRTEQMTAAEILARVASVYSSCRAYSDEGEVSTKFDIAFSKPLIYRFSTAFVRPAAFRFELRSGVENKGNRYVAWKAGDLEKAGWPIGARHESIDETLLGLSSISNGSSLTVPALLLPDLFRGRGLFASLTEVVLHRDEKVDGHRAFKIEAALQDDNLKFWVDANQFLILKISHKSTVGRFDQETTTRYWPLLNTEVSPQQLAFNPPTADVQNVGPPIASAEPNIATSTDDSPRLKTFGSSLRLNKAEINKLKRQANRRSDDEDVVRVDTDMVVCDVLILDQQGRTISGLTRDDFTVKEDKQTQAVSSFSLGDSDAVPRSIVLIIDYSSSQLPYVITSVEAAKTLVDKLNPHDHMALVTDDVKLLVDFTSDKRLLKATLDSLKARAMSGWMGRSKQYDALMATLNELFTREDQRPIIIFQTDGDQLDELSGRPRPTMLEPYVPPMTFTFEDLVATADSSRATIYSIIPGVPFMGLPLNDQLKNARTDWENRQRASAELRRVNNIPDQNSRLRMPSDSALMANAQLWYRLHLALASLAKGTGAWADYLEQPEQANELYTRVLNDINRRYVIGYYPTNRTRDGKRRTVSIEVRGHPEYNVAGRKTYFAPQP
jgi:VWFA-related protein